MRKSKWLLILVLLTAGKAGATELAGWHWSDRTAHMSAGDLMTTTVGGGINWDAVFLTAVSRWNNSDVPFSLTADRQTQAQGCTYLDANTAFFAADTCTCSDSCGQTNGAWPNQVVGVTITWSDATGEAAQSSILFNSNESWDVYSGPVTSDVDFTRVAVHELGHTIGLGHTNDDRAIMFPVGTSTVAPHANDVSSAQLVSGVGRLSFLNDFNSSGSDEIAILRARHPDFRTWVQLSELNTGQFAQSMYFHEGPEPVGLFVLEDLDSDGAQEVGVFQRRPSDDRARVEIRGSEDRGLLAAYYNTVGTIPIGAFSLGDVNSNGTDDLALLVVRGQDNRALIQVREALSAQHLGNIYFAPGFHPLKAVRVPDLNGNSVDEVAALLVSRSTGDLRLEVRDGATGIFIALLPQPEGYIGKDIAFLGEANGTAYVATLIEEEEGEAVSIRVHNAANGVSVRNLTWPSGYSVIAQQGLTGFADISGNSFPEVGVMLQRYSDNQPIIQIRDASSGSLIQAIGLGGDSIGQAIANVGNRGGSAAEDVAVLEFASTGKGRVRVFDAQTKASVGSTITASIPGTDI